VLTQQAARDFVRKQLKRLIDRQSFRSVVPPDASSAIGGFRAHSLSESQPPRGPAFAIIVIVQQLEQVSFGRTPRLQKPAAS
jgi:hypothetical protein